MDERKRPTATRSRGNSPPSQRRRQSEQSSTADRYANKAYPRVTPSPPRSRRNSAAGLPAIVRPGPASYPSHERHVDQNRPSTNYNIPYNHKRPQVSAATANLRTANTDRSPFRAVSPINNGSRSNTPMQAAPEVTSMLPATQKSTTSYSLPVKAMNMETLKFLRSRKAFNATDVPQVTAGTTALEVKTLKAQLRAAQLDEANLQSRVKQLEYQIKKFDTLPAQLAALNAQVEGQDRAAAPKASSATDTNKDDLADIMKEITSIKEQQQAMQDNIRTTILSEIKEMGSFRPKHTKTLKNMSTKLGANQKVCEDPNKHDLPGQLQTLQDRVTDINDMVGVTDQNVTDLEIVLKKLHDDNNTMYHDIRNYIGPIERSYINANKTTILQRMENLEDESTSLRREQERLSSEHEKLVTKVHNLRAGPTDSISERFEDIEKTVSSLGEDTQELTNRVDTLEASSTGNEQLKKAVDGLEDRVSGSESILKQVQADQLEQKSNTGRIQMLENEQAGLSNKHKPIAGQVVKFGRQQESLVNQQKALETGPTRLSEEWTRLGQTLDHGADRISGLSDVESIQQRLRSVEDRIEGKTGLAKIIDDIQDDCSKFEEEIYNNTRDIELCRSNFVAIFDQNLDPFKKVVKQQLITLSQNISHQSESLAKLGEQIAEQQTASPAPGLTATQLADLNNVVRDTTTLKQTLESLQNSVKNELEYRDTVVEELKVQMASKQDTISATQANDIVKAAVRNLQDQYNSITTDEIHAKMVHWFLQQYPSTSAGLAQKFADLQYEVAQLRDLTNLTNWDPRYLQALSALVRIEPQLQALVQSPLGPDGSPEMLAKTNEALTTMKEAIEKAQKQNEALTRTVGGLQTSMHTLNSGNTPFAKAESVAALQQSMGTLQANVEALLKENPIAHSRNSRFEEPENGKIKTISKQVEDLQCALTSIRADLDEMLNKFLTPTNKVLLSRLPALLIVTGQVQDLLESLNQNLPKGPLEFSWYHDFNTDLSAIPAPRSDNSRMTAR